MATPTGTRKRAQPATHPTVYLGLLLAVVGLLLAMYAYTGTRIYDVMYAYVAIGGGLLALVGIMVAAWGRAILASRAQRARRAVVREAVERKAAPAEEETPPTVAAPKEKKRVAMPSFSFRKRTAERKPEGHVFSFRRSRDANGATSTSSAPAAAALEAPHAPATEDGATVRITLRCPRCTTQFSAEGVQPLAVACPSCGLSGTV